MSFAANVAPQTLSQFPCHNQLEGGGVRGGEVTFLCVPPRFIITVAHLLHKWTVSHRTVKCLMDARPDAKKIHSKMETFLQVF